MDPETKYFKCTKCRYILGTKGTDYAAPCPMCRGYMMPVDESDPDVRRFRAAKLHGRGPVLTGGRYAKNV